MAYSYGLTLALALALPVLRWRAQILVIVSHLKGSAPVVKCFVSLTNRESRVMTRQCRVCRGWMRRKRPFIPTRPDPPERQISLDLPTHSESSSSGIFPTVECIHNRIAPSEEVCTRITPPDT